MNIRNFVSKLLSMQKIKLSKQYSVPKKSSLGQGGNGVVCKVIRNSDKQAFALKRLVTMQERSTRRYCVFKMK